MLVGLLAEEVDVGVVGLLVGEEHRVEARLAECGDDALLAVEAVVVLGGGGSEEHGYALVRGVRLRAHVAEHHQSLRPHELGIGRAAVAVELEVGRARRLAYDEHIHLRRVLGVGGAGVEAEACHILLVVGRAVALSRGEIEIVENVGGIHVVLDVILKSALRLVALGIAEVARCRHQSKAPCSIQRQAAHTKEKVLTLVPSGNLTPPIVGNAHVLRPLHGGYREQRQIENDHSRHSRHEVVEQLHSLAGVGRHEIEEHVDGYHAVAVEIDEHHLEGGEEHEREQHPHLPPRLPRQRHQQCVDRQREEYVDKACHKWHVLGEAQRDIGNDEGKDGIEP